MAKFKIHLEPKRVWNGNGYENDGDSIVLSNGVRKITLGEITPFGNHDEKKKAIDQINELLKKL